MGGVGEVSWAASHRERAVVLGTEKETRRREDKDGERGARDFATESSSFSLGTSQSYARAYSLPLLLTASYSNSQTVCLGPSPSRSFFRRLFRRGDAQDHDSPWARRSSSSSSSITPGYTIIFSE